MAEALDRVLEILRTTELYSPQLGTKDEDPHTSDLVGGLMTVSDEKEPRESLRAAVHGVQRVGQVWVTELNWEFKHTTGCIIS